MVPLPPLLPIPCKRNDAGTRHVPAPDRGRQREQVGGDMGLVQRFDRKLESTVGDAFARVFGGSIVPQEVEGMLRREAADGVRSLQGGRLLAPNEYVITLSTSDHQKVVADRELTADAFAKHLAGYISDQGWQTYGDVVVRFAESSQLHTGQVRARGVVNPDAIPHAPAGPAPRHRTAEPAPSESDQAFTAEPGVPAMTDNPSYRGSQGQGQSGDEYYDDRYGRPQEGRPRKAVRRTIPAPRSRVATRRASPTTRRGRATPSRAATASRADTRRPTTSARPPATARPRVVTTPATVVAPAATASRHRATRTVRPAVTTAGSSLPAAAMTTMAAAAIPTRVATPTRAATARATRIRATAARHPARARTTAAATPTRVATANRRAATTTTARNTKARSTKARTRATLSRITASPATTNPVTTSPPRAATTTARPARRATPVAPTSPCSSTTAAAAPTSCAKAPTWWDAGRTPSSGCRTPGCRVATWRSAGTARWPCSRT
ncbi:FHA domain containing protein [Mycolicibacterium tokaiense]|uniref:FHA domain containing protein n=1 Tax=Mycolicibacterium tokaiense TaxID=39695 RepID=A0A378TGA2_9MYCO|nr:FHA domain containing protein [Mycolicibacterium tokaiense]